jgi:AcrR family transcriptional regulator
LAWPHEQVGVAARAGARRQNVIRATNKLNRVKPAAHAHPTQQAPESLRERKKRMTREAIFAAAQALFGERGFDAVTVAEIADAANISVKTLFTYIGTKEELLFSAGPTVLDGVVEAVTNRRLGQTPLVAAGQALLAAVDDQDQDTNLDAFLRLAHAGPAARSRLRALWDETEDALTAALSTRRDGPHELAARRLTAAQIMVLVRTVTSAEVGDLIAKETDTEQGRQEALKAWIRDAAGHLARGLQAAGR